MHLEQPDSYLKTTNLIFSFDEVYFLLLEWWWDGVNLFEIDGEMEMSIAQGFRDGSHFSKGCRDRRQVVSKTHGKGVSTW